MKRDFVFVWSPEVQPAIAALSAPKIAQLRVLCDKLIVRAEYYRQNPMLLVRIVETPQLCAEDLPWAPFEKFGYWFRLDYQDEQRAYVLSFAKPPEELGRASATDGTKPSARQARIRKPAKARDERVACRVSWRDLIGAADGLYGGLRPPVASFVRLFLRFGAFATVRARNSAGVLCDMLSRLTSITRRVFASSSSTPADGHHGREAVLEPRLLGQNTGIAMLIYTLVWNDEPIVWSADLFGAPKSERF